VLVVFCLLVFGATSLAAAQTKHVPTIDELLTLKSVGAVSISPDAKWIAYTVSYGDFKPDAFVNQIFLADVATGRTFQVTRGEKSSGSIRWSPDSQWLGFLSNQPDLRDQPTGRRSNATNEVRDFDR
jgi:dipeptidyl aminopeptidase/acylaminoacyl peptidase